MANHPVREFVGARHSKVVVWDNGDKGLAFSITPPQYQDKEGIWKAGNFWIQDLASIIRQLERAQQFGEDWTKKTE